LSGYDSGICKLDKVQAALAHACGLITDSATPLTPAQQWRNHLAKEPAAQACLAKGLRLSKNIHPCDVFRRATSATGIILIISSLLRGPSVCFESNILSDVKTPSTLSSLQGGDPYGATCAQRRCISDVRDACAQWPMIAIHNHKAVG